MNITYKIYEEIDSDFWNSIAAEFEDNNLYQSWQYNSILSKKQNYKIINIIVFENKTPIIASSLRIKNLLGYKIAYILNGPTY